MAIVKKVAKPAAKAAPAKKPGTKSKLSPALQKAQAARARNKAAGKKAVVKKPAFIYKAPEDFKPFFMDVKIRTAADGLLAPKFKVERVRGRWDNADAKRYDMMEYDPTTVAAFISRLSGAIYAPNPVRRLPGNTTFRLIIRVSISRGITLSARVVQLAMFVKSAKTGKMRESWLSDPKDPKPERKAARSKLRRASRVLGGAFTNVLLPPSTRKAKAEAEE